MIVNESNTIENQNINNVLENYQNNQNNSNDNNKVPSTLLVARAMQNHESFLPMKVLFDSGGSSTMIHARCLPVGAAPSLLPKKSKFQTIAGAFDSSREVFLEDVVFPEFDKTKRVSGLKAFVFDADCNYDMILGRDILHKIGLTLDFENKQMKWMENIVPMKTYNFWQSPLSYFWALDDDDDGEENIESFVATQILDAKYEK